MAIRQESAQILMNEALQELTELNERKKQLEDLINNLRKLTGAEPLEAAKESGRVHFPIIRKPRIVRKRITHAPQITEILKQSGKATMRVPEIVAQYRERGLKLTKNGTDVIRTVIKNHPDMFLYKDGNVSLINQQ